MIKPIQHSDFENCLSIIRESFASVAKEFSITEENCPNRTSFISMKNLEYHAKNNYKMYGYFINDNLIGYVSLENKGDGIFELRNLAVLPEYRHKGIGKQILDFCKVKVKEFDGNKITLGIIEENAILRNWYAANGFLHTGTKTFEHLPFITGYMECTL